MAYWEEITSLVKVVVECCMGRKYYTAARADLMEFPASDVTTLKRFVGIMINFVKTLNPTPRRENLFQNLKWPTVTPDEFQYMDFNTDLSVRSNPRKETYRNGLIFTINMLLNH
ncbi:hypothetical protein JTB14_030193 [Gonioctena quinquepunctata]|nr:hypothetical protein JTB14_030193 [Gonioctena quinquepunctata]